MINATEKWLLLSLIAIFVIFFAAILGAKRRTRKALPPLANKTPDRSTSSSVEPADPNVKSAKEVLAEPTQSGATPEPESHVSPPPSLPTLAEKGFWQSLFSRLKSPDLGNTSEWEALEELLYSSDLSPKLVQQVLESISRWPKDTLANSQILKQKVKDLLLPIFQELPSCDSIQSLSFTTTPAIVLVTGINGAGKTTTLAKLAYLAVQKQKKVLLAAGDTFRAAAAEQLVAWAERLGVDIHSPPEVKDPAAVAFQAIERAKKEGHDLVLIDTAGRLQSSHNLMEELKKIYRVIQKAEPTAPHGSWLVLDATNGQNALVQAQKFKEAAGLTGVILTKMDSSAKGGIAISVAYDLKLPILWLGLGEKPQDFIPFKPGNFLDSLLEDLGSDTTAEGIPTIKSDKEVRHVPS